ncbi:hypothetical protein DSOL_1400 [Desulfosporosinus metallidurans]|uniref:Uncharacterized protein n=1 Tax=Desulfosporosinus metallidurans TaxID=1888891 RepID=A0A1Q8QZ48_9FIRM|nr:hypothetical protein DSOL_1400 [Desulfosporosinus metallidurans]
MEERQSLLLSLSIRIGYKKGITQNYLNYPFEDDHNTLVEIKLHDIRIKLGEE